MGNAQKNLSEARPEAAAILTPAGAESIRSFRRTVRAFYQKNRRDMPWRETADPYHIVVSEIMLQQTQVERVHDKYLFFVKALPDFSSLAQAPLQQVLALWQGLGYNRRAIALKKIAGLIISQFDGELPSSVDMLRRLPGIGHATASSIAAFAFNVPTAFIETNIRRVFIHHFFDDRLDVHDSEIMPLVSAALDRRNPREWYYALMDYGSALKKQIPNPNRRSVHYVRQSRFEGSSRQKRGAVLKFLLNHPGCSADDIADRLGIAPADILHILQKLVAENFLAYIRKRYHVV
ncbi:MAG TPA: winged helix-turn-helix transcriptional regulator [Dissulfurispiraceae bacterium]|nr:winged helix-turn-helix transcriptional regulator [Dissulfurispiraceae bacterium]